MEIIGLVVIVLGLMAYYGIFGSVETAARMGNRKMDMLEKAQIDAHIKELNGKDAPSDEEFASAIAKKKLYSKFRDL